MVPSDLLNGWVSDPMSGKACDVCSINGSKQERFSERLRYSPLLLAILMTCLGFLAGCERTNQHEQTAPGDLRATIAGYVAGSSDKDRSTALYLLSSLSLEPVDIERVDSICKKLHEAFDALLCAYFRYQKLQSQEAAQVFVQRLPAEAASLRTLMTNRKAMESVMADPEEITFTKTKVHRGSSQWIQDGACGDRNTDSEWQIIQRNFRSLASSESVVTPIRWRVKDSANK